MLNEKELNQLRKNAKVHRQIFDEIKKIVKE
jgi:methionine aminopeptidase